MCSCPARSRSCARTLERIEHERAAAARREADAAEAERRRQRELAAAQAQQEEIARNAAAARAEAERIERERAETARRAVEAAKAARHRRDAEAEQLRAEALVVQRESSVAEAPLDATPVDAAIAEAPSSAFSWCTSRPLQVAAVLLALFAATWTAGGWPGRAPRGSSNRGELPNQNDGAPASKPVPVTRPRTPAVETASASPRVEPLPSTPTPIASVQPTVGPVPAGAVPKQPSENPAARQASASPRLDELRRRARLQAQSGQAAQALSSVAEGLQIDPTDPALRSVQNSLLRDAQAKTARSKHDAENLESSARAEEPFERGLQAEKQAAALRRAGRIDAAIRSLWTAAGEFGAAAAASKKIADAEAEPAPLAAEPPPVKTKGNDRPESPGRQQPRANDQAARGVPDPTIEQDLVNQVFRRYEAAYATLSADSVRSVYPSAPLDRLATDFAACRSYTHQDRAG